MDLSQDGQQLIKRFEQLRLTGYLPTPHDKPTIGWGHTGKTLNGAPVRLGVTITEAEAESLFLLDIQWAVKFANTANDERSVENPPLLQPQFDALVSLIFNIGQHSFEYSHLRKAIVAADEAQTRAQWKVWCYQAGEILPGLINRRNAEWSMWSTALVTT